MNKTRSRSVLLVQPPYADFTYPYHSLSYVAAPLRKAGYEVDVIDLNAVWFRYVFTADQILGWRRDISRQLEKLNSCAHLSIAQQSVMVQLIQALSICDTVNPESVVRVMRSDRIYNFDSYYEARAQVRAFEKLLGHFYAPYDFFSSFAIPTFEPSASTLIARAKAMHRFTRDVAKLLAAEYPDRDYFLCGVSFPFSTHLAPGLATFRGIRELWPKAITVAGGTAITDVYRYRKGQDSLRPFAELCDYFYIGEAETGVVQFAAWASGDAPVPPAQAIHLTSGNHSDSGRLPYVALSTQGSPGFVRYSWHDSAPDYDWINWDLYLSPHKRVNYTPARGCFWNQCTFCDYGLNTEGPTAPSRTMDAAVAVQHLRSLHEKGIDHVYLAVDAIAPKFLGAFAKQLIEDSIPIHWSTQFFLTRQFSGCLVRLLEQSGLRVASFGLESGSSRVLEAMGKGKNRIEEVILPALEAFRNSSIGLQPLFFFGFPGETDEDRQRTVDLLRENVDVFVTVSKAGLFDLLPGSFVAKDPAKYGVRSLRRIDGDDIAGSMTYELEQDSCAFTCSSMTEFNDQLPHWNVYERPWAGGVDTFHTQLYVEAYGRSGLHRIRESNRERREPRSKVVIDAAFDLEEVIQNVVISQALRTDVQQQPARTLQFVAGQALETLWVPLSPEPVSRTYRLDLRQYQEI